MQKKVTRTIEEVVNVCDSCGKEVAISNPFWGCAICGKDICADCKTSVELNSSIIFFVCPECKKSLTIQQVEDRLNEKNKENRIRKRNNNL